MAFSKTDQNRITFLSLLSSAVQFSDEPYQQALDWLQDMNGDGFFEEEVSAPSSSRPERSSAGRGSSTKSGSRGRDRARGGGSNGGFTIKDPSAPATKAQIGKLLSLTEDYTWEEAEEFTKGEISAVIDELVSN